MARPNIIEPPRLKQLPPSNDSSFMLPTLPSCRCRRLESVDVSGESGRGTSGGSVQSQTDSAAVVLSAHEQVNRGRWKDSVDS